MGTGSNGTYTEFCDALESRFAQAYQTELYRAMLRETRQYAHESLPELRLFISAMVNGVQCTLL